MHMKQFRASFLFLVVLCIPCSLFGQDTVSRAGSLVFPDLPQFTYGQGLGITSPDSLYQLNIRFRMQNRLSFDLDDGEVIDVESRVRRVRLRFDGFVFSPRIRYALQLSFAREDIGDFIGAVPNILRDGMVYYEWNPQWIIGFGQTKLPGNRERVVSSGDLQLADRSMVNNIFNLDRDFGIQVFHQRPLVGPFHYALKTALSTGEGRNWVSSSGGFLCYTVRGELLPLGMFTNKGDYFQGDLVRETSPKLSLAATYSYNHGALRTQGQRGEALFNSRDITTFIADGLFKYRGWALSAEYARKLVDDPITRHDADPSRIAFIHKGEGLALQGSYLFPGNYELVARMASIHADEEILAFVPETSRAYTFGANKYLRGHRLKIQADVSWQEDTWQGIRPRRSDFWQFRFQVELGI
jgi:phosphate-selective porin OprO and OprP